MLKKKLTKCDFNCMKYHLSVVVSFEESSQLTFDTFDAVYVKASKPCPELPVLCSSDPLSHAMNSNPNTSIFVQCGARTVVNRRLLLFDTFLESSETIGGCEFRRRQAVDLKAKKPLPIFIFNSSKPVGQLKDFARFQSDGNLHTEHALFFPIETPRLYNYLSDVLQCRTPYVHGYDLLSCTHSPSLHGLLTSCCEPNWYRKLPNWQPRCVRDRCSASIGACRSKKTSRIDMSGVHAAMSSILYTEAKDRLVSRLKRAFGIEHIQIYSIVGSMQLRNLGIERLTPGEVGYRFAIYTAVLDAIARKKSLMWFDDDILLDNEFQTSWRSIQYDGFCTGFWDNPGGILLFGASEWTKKEAWKHIDEETARCYDAFSKTRGSFGFLASVQTLPWIRRWLALTNLPFDHIYSFVQQKGFPVRVSRPNLMIMDFFHRSTISDHRHVGHWRLERMRWNMSRYS